MYNKHVASPRPVNMFREQAANPENGEASNIVELTNNTAVDEENWKKPLLFFDQNFRRCSISSESHSINPNNSLLNIGNYVSVLRTWFEY